MAFQHILVPVDGSETASAAFQQAIEIAKTFNSKVILVQVLKLDPYIAAEYISAAQSNEFIERAKTAILKTLTEAKEKLATENIDVETQLLEGQVISSEIIKAAQNAAVDLIVIGSHGRTGLKKLFLGSVAQSILGETDIPVLVVRK